LTHSNIWTDRGRGQSGTGGNESFRKSPLIPPFPTTFLAFIDSKGHSRFVLRILIILSHRSRKQGESLPPLWKLLTRRGRVVKALPYDKQREVLPPLPVKRGYLLSSLAQHNPTSETDETNSPGRG